MYGAGDEDSSWAELEAWEHHPPLYFTPFIPDELYFSSYHGTESKTLKTSFVRSARNQLS